MKAYGKNEQGCYVQIGIDYDHPNGGRNMETIAEALEYATEELCGNWEIIVESDNCNELIRIPLCEIE